LTITVFLLPLIPFWNDSIITTLHTIHCDTITFRLHIRLLISDHSDHLGVQFYIVFCSPILPFTFYILFHILDHRYIYCCIHIGHFYIPFLPVLDLFPFLPLGLFHYNGDGGGATDLHANNYITTGIYHYSIYHFYHLVTFLHFNLYHTPPHSCYIYHSFLATCRAIPTYLTYDIDPPSPFTVTSFYVVYILPFWWTYVRSFTHTTYDLHYLRSFHLLPHSEFYTIPLHTILPFYHLPLHSTTIHIPTPF